MDILEPQESFSEAAILSLPSRRVTAMALPMLKATAMKAMKGTGMKAMKAKKFSVIAQGKLARALVYSGRKQKTQSGMTKASFIRSQSGQIGLAQNDIRKT